MNKPPPPPVKAEVAAISETGTLTISFNRPVGINPDFFKNKIGSG